MCIAVPVEVIETKGTEALIEIGGVKKWINTMLLADVVVGDYVLLHAGCAMQTIDKDEAMKTLEIIEQLKDLYEA